MTPKTNGKPGRKPGPRKVKKLVSLDADVAERVDEEGAKHGITGSAWIAQAVTKKFRK